MSETACNRCGGGIDADHPTTCSACLWERMTGRSYEQTVDEAHAKGKTFAEYAAELRAAPHKGAR